MMSTKDLEPMTAHISEDGLQREESVAGHTENTRSLCDKKGKRCGMSQIMSLCGIYHDTGKCKQSFNTYIHADDNTKRKQKGSIAHASTGAKQFYEKYHDRPGNLKILAEMISYAVAAHHGLFDCVDADHTDIFTKRVSNVEDYDEACGNAKRAYLEDYEPDQIYAKASEEFAQIWNKIRDLYERLKPKLTAKYGKEARGMLADCKFFLLACLQRLILSILIDSDWEATSDFMGHVDTLTKQSDSDAGDVFAKAGENFAAYMQKKKESIAGTQLTPKERQIYDARNALQEKCVRFAKHPAGIYCLPIPTGGGKTLSSLAYALEFCRQHPEIERIVYVSPYISITEQNAQVFREAIGNEKWILEHHSSVVKSQETEDEDYRRNRFSRYEINWEEPFICTTFVQFMNTLFSDKSESVRRMHRLVNAVIIIDEVQSMPLKCVHTFNYMINFLNGVCNADIILCTATQPALEATQCPVCYSEPKYMIQNQEDWFRKFERVEIRTPSIGQRYTFESLGEEIAFQTKEYRSILVVLNTKSAVRKLYDLLKGKSIRVEYLTTNLCAEHRSDRIKAIKAVLADKRENIVVVSTNLIEAGVDISFECVYRSMAGLDSLAQTAGRCNRNGEMGCGMVRLVILEGENTGNMEELQQNIRVTEMILDEYDRCTHNGECGDNLLMAEWMDMYYKNVYSASADKMNFPIEELDTNMVELLSGGFGTAERTRFMNQAYKTAGQAYRVIDDSSFGVIVPYGKGVEIIEAIQETADEEKIKACIRQAQRFTVNVRGSQLRKLEGLIQPVSGSMPNLYMVAAPGAYSNDYGIAPEWENLII